MIAQEIQPLNSGKVVNFSGSAVVQDENQPATAGATTALIEGHGERFADGATDEESSKMQVCWNQAMCKEMKIAEGYQNVAVLIIKWDKKIDQLNCENEVGELEELFRQSFNYHTEVVELNNSSKAQLQLNCAVMNFVHKHNGPHNLLIIYYTGHGSYNEMEGSLELHASEVYGHISNVYPDQASWNRAERPLIEEADCDVLTIFDTCFASNIQKNGQLENLRTYELFAASGHDQTTSGPGPRSFTSALISSLRDLLEECGDSPFTTRQLCEKVNLHPKRRKNQSHVWSRFKRYDRYIALAPLKRTPSERREDFHNEQTRALLSLRLPLTVERPTDEQISAIARAFSKAVKDLKAPVKRIDWVGLQSWGHTRSFADMSKAIGSALKWKKKTFSNRRQRSPVTTRDEMVQTIDGPQAQRADDSPALPSRKRKLSGGDNDTPSSSSYPLEERERRRKNTLQRHIMTPPSGSEPETGW